MDSYFPRIIIPKSSPEQFEATTEVNSRIFRMNLIDGQLEIIMPVSHQTGMLLLDM
jgi:hypothetical protein